MAKKQIDTIGIRFEATEAINDAEKLKTSLEGMGERYKFVCEQLKDVSNLSKAAVSALEKEKVSLEKSMSSVAKLVDNAITQLRNIDDILADLSGAKFNELTRARNAQALRVKRLSPDAEGYAEEIELLQRTNREIELRNKLFRDMSEEERESLKITRDAIVANAKRFSVSEIQNAIKFTKELRDLEKIDSDEYKRYQQEADALQEVLDLNKKIAEEKERQEAEARRVNTIVNRGTASVDQLKEALKLTEQLRDAEDRGSYNYEYYKSEVEELQKALEATKELSLAEQQRIEQQRQAVVNDPTKASVEQIKEAIKQTEKLRNTKPIDTSDYKDYDEQLTKLKDTLKETEQPVKNIALSASEMKKALKDIKSQPLEKLEQMASQLEEELSKLAPNTKEFIRTSQNLRYVKDQMGEVKEAWQQHDGQILATIKRLSAYVAVYGSYNFIAGKLKDMVKGWLDLSDTLADVEKTTGLAHKQLAMLSKDIDAIDTRTTQEGMHQLAAVAGQIGLRSREDILGFVKAADQLTVALNELGDDGVQSLAKLAQLTGDVSRLGVEQSLLAIGSSINELSAASSAAAGPIADFMRRTGGMANMANLSSADLAALGATADALGQPIETAATAMNKFVTTLVTSTDDVAYALNLDLQEMQSLIDSGETMTAITKVLDAVRLKGDEGALGGIFKELGSEGARMQQTMMALAENVSFLKTQVHTSRDAFAEATSATQEYNVKNETAAAIVERIGNTVREFFVTAEGVQWLTGPLNGILDIVKGLTGVSDAATKARGAMAALITLFVTKKWWAALVLWLKQVNDQIKAQTIGVVGLRKVWIALKTAMSATNVISLALAAVSAAVVGIATAMAGAKKQAEYLGEALSDLREQEEGEKDRLKELTKLIKTSGEGTKERAEAIDKFNNLYSSYLGYLISEKDDVEDLTRAYNLLNAQMELRYAKMLETEYMKGPLEEYGREMRKVNSELRDDIEDDATRMGVSQKTLLSAVSQVAKDFAKEGNKVDFFYWGEQDFAKALKATQDLVGVNGSYIDALVMQNRGLINDMIENEMDLLEARETAAAEGAIVTAEAENRVSEARKASMDGLKAEIEQYAKNSDAIKAMNKSELESIIDRGNTVLEYMQNESVEQSEMDAFVAQLDIIREVYAGDAWGKALNLPGLEKAYGNLENLGTASVDNLVQMYQSLEKAGQRYTDVNFFNEIFGEKKKVQTIDEMHAFFKDYARQIKARLKELGYTTAGNFDWSGDKGGKKKEEMKREFEAAKSLLLAYYEQRATIIKQAYLDQEITMEEKNRQITANEQEKSRALVDFYSVLLGETKKYGIEIEKILEGKDLQKLANFLNMLGPAMVDGMRLGREQSEGAIRDEAIKIREIIEKALLEGDMFGKLETEFRTMLDELSLLTSKFGSEFIAVDESTAKALVSQLVGMADEAYTMTEQELLAEAKKRSKGNETLTAWWSGVDEDQLTLILEKLKVYYDDRLEMQRRYTQRMQREWQQYYKQTGGEAAYEAEKALVEQAKSRQDKIGGTSRSDYHQRLGLVSTEVDNEVKKIDSNMEFLGKAIENRKNEIVGDLMTIIEAEELVLLTLTEGTEEYESQKNLIDSLKGKMASIISGDSELQALYGQQLDLQADRNAKMAEGESLLTDIMVSEWERRAEKMSTWTEMMGDYLGDWLSLEYQANQARLRGDEETAKELEAQQEESKQNLIKSALNELVELGKVWATEYAMKLMYNSANLAADTTTAAASTGVAVTEASSKLVAGGYAAAGKEIGSKGWVGLATGAAIIAAAVGLAAALKAAIANMFPEAVEGVKDAEASTPKRKLTTGMLTYANGKYPVLGNDGVVYDAEYAGANMKTGVYRGPHYGIFSEKKPEMVIDGNTTQRLVLNYPEVYNGILQLSRTGSMRTYADGNVSEFAAATSAQQQMQMEQMQMTLAATAAAVHALTERLKYPLSAEVNYFGKGGTRDAEKRGGRWAKRMRVD